jgi:hypothetical protein
MNRLTRTFAFAVLATCWAGLAAAQTVPGSFKDMQFLVKAGDRVTVTDASGAKITGRISELDAAILSIASASGSRRFTQDDVVLVRQRRADPLKNGALIGATIGAGMGLMTELSCGGNEQYCGQAGWVTLGSTLWGLGVGVFTDALLKTPTDVFRRGTGPVSSWTVSPVVGRAAAGARVALRW